MDLHANVKYVLSNSQYTDKETVTRPEVFCKKDLLKNFVTILSNICKRLLDCEARGNGVSIVDLIC